MKLSVKELSVGIAMAKAIGAIEENMRTKTSSEVDKTFKGWQSMLWENDWFKTNGDNDGNGRGYYYLGYDQISGGYVVEWRGKVENDSHFVEHVITGPNSGYRLDAVKLIVKAIKDHKRYLEKEYES